MRKLPVGESDFRTIREKDLLYIDKTEDLYRLISEGKYYFLSRPRRFGKSLLVNTLRELFSGHQELFEDLWIYNKITWKKHPIISFSFNNIDYKELGIELALCNKLDLLASQHRLELKSSTAKSKFNELIIALNVNERVVILIDEYDKPILDYLHDIEKADNNRETLKNFFGTLKGNDIVGRLQFVFLTGVSKFSRVSIFSELNNLTDLTNHPKFSTMLGITQAELENNFEPYIDHLSLTIDIAKPQLFKEIQKWYNGYSWDGKNFLYNPHSLLHLFHTGQFENFWFQSGTSSWLIKNMRLQGIKLEQLEQKVVFSSFFDKFNLNDIDSFVLLHQTGYLTIKQVVQRGVRKHYTISYPNFEVRSSFLENIFEEYAHKRKSEIGETIIQLENALLENKPEIFIQLFQTIFADISHRLLQQYIETNNLNLWEAYYHTVIYVALNLVATQSFIDCEVQTNKGYTDAIVVTEQYIYVMEFKVGKAEEAISQIKRKKYYQKFINENKTIILIGIGFDSKERNINDWIVETLSL